MRPQRLRLRMDRDIKGAPADVEEQPGDRRIERVAEALHRIELANLRQGQDQRFLGRAFDLDLVALLNDGEAFARLEPELLLTLVHPVFERDDRRSHDDRADVALMPAIMALRRMVAPVPSALIADVHQAGDQDSDPDHHQLVFEHRPRVGAEERPDRHGRGIEQPETEDRFDGERPIAEPGPRHGVRHHEHWHCHVPKLPSRKPPLARWQKHRPCRSKHAPGRNAEAFPLVSRLQCLHRWRSCCECSERT